MSYETLYEDTEKSLWVEDNIDRVTAVFIAELDLDSKCTSAHSKLHNKIVDKLSELDYEDPQQEYLNMTVEEEWAFIVKYFHDQAIECIKSDYSEHIDDVISKEFADFKGVI
jgi:hypothetical protein